MADHDTLRGRDLHEPSTDVIQNNTGTFIPIGNIVPLDNLRTTGSRPVSRLANDGEIPVGFVLRAIETDGTDSVLTYGKIEPYDTTGLTKGEKLKSNQGGTALVTTVNGAGAIAEVTLGGTVNGSLTFNGLTGLITDNSRFIDTFSISDWTVVSTDSTMRELEITHNLDNINAGFEFYDSNNEPTWVPPFQQAATTITFRLLTTEIFSGRIIISD